MGWVDPWVGLGCVGLHKMDPWTTLVTLLTFLVGFSFFNYFSVPWLRALDSRLSWLSVSFRGHVSKLISYRMCHIAICQTFNRYSSFKLANPQQASVPFPGNKVFCGRPYRATI